MNYRLLLQSVLFVAEGLLLVLPLVEMVRPEARQEAHEIAT